MGSQISGPYMYQPIKGHQAPNITGLVARDMLLVRAWWPVISGIHISCECVGTYNAHILCDFSQNGLTISYIAREMRKEMKLHTK